MPGFRATTIAREIRAGNPKVAVIGFARAGADGSAPALDGVDGDTLLKPFEPELVRREIITCHRTSHRRCPGEHPFVPPGESRQWSVDNGTQRGGKPGRYWRQNVLLIETDLHSGCLSVALQVEPEHSILEALEEADELRERSWERIVTQVHGLNLLLATRGKQGTNVAPWQYQHLLAFAGPRYDTIVADLPEVVNEATETIVRQAAKVHVVGTPEVPSLFLARRRLQDLEQRGVPRERLGLIVNRVEDDGRTIEELEGVVERPIVGELPNDYQLTLEARPARRGRHIPRPGLRIAGTASCGGGPAGSSSPSPRRGRQPSRATASPQGTERKLLGC